MINKIPLPSLRLGSHQNSYSGTVLHVLILVSQIVLQGLIIFKKWVTLVKSRVSRDKLRHKVHCEVYGR